jgi:hypothetical protein
MPLPPSGHHECTLSQTNAGGFVYVCTCGDVGAVRPAPVHEHPKTKKRTKDYDLAKREAKREWERHFRMAHVPLVPPDLSRARPQLTHLGRFGHP